MLAPLPLPSPTPPTAKPEVLSPGDSGTGSTSGLAVTSEARDTQHLLIVGDVLKKKNAQSRLPGQQSRSVLPEQELVRPFCPPVETLSLTPAGRLPLPASVLGHRMQKLDPSCTGPWESPLARHMAAAQMDNL